MSLLILSRGGAALWLMSGKAGLMAQRLHSTEGPMCPQNWRKDFWAWVRGPGTRWSSWLLSCPRTVWKADDCLHFAESFFFFFLMFQHWPRILDIDPLSDAKIGLWVSGTLKDIFLSEKYFLAQMTQGWKFIYENVRIPGPWTKWYRMDLSPPTSIHPARLREAPWVWKSKLSFKRSSEMPELVLWEVFQTVEFNCNYKWPL